MKKLGTALLGIFLILGLSSAEAYSKEGGAYYMDAGDTREEVRTTAQSYSLLGRLRVDQNELPAQGPALAGAEILVEWDRDNGLAGCDRIYQANEGDILRTTASDNPDTPGDETGRFSINGLVSGKTYCITFRNKPGFNNKTYLWPTTGTGDDIDNYFVMRESATYFPQFILPAPGVTGYTAIINQPMDDGTGLTPAGLHFQATDQNIGDRVSFSISGTTPIFWMTVTILTNPGNPAHLVLTGTPPASEDGRNYPITIEAEDRWGNVTSRVYTVTVGTLNNPPSFTTSTNLNTSPGDSGISFQATDGEGDTVTISVVSNNIPWLSCPPSSSGTPPVNLVCTGSPSVAQLGEGSPGYSVRLHLVDGRGASPYFDTIFRITATRFKEVTATHLLTPDTNATPSADVADVNGDGLLDLLIAHLPSSVGTATQGTRLLINNYSGTGVGKFTDITGGAGGRFRDFNGNATTYYSNGIRLGRQTAGAPLNLFLSSWERVENGARPYPCNMTEEAVAYRLVYDTAAGHFKPERDSTGSAEFIQRGQIGDTRCNGGLVDFSFAQDIEIGRMKDEGADLNKKFLHGFFANASLGEEMNSPPYRWIHYDNAGVNDYHFYTEALNWRDNKTKKGYWNVSEFYYSTGNPFPSSDAPGKPTTSDIELADVDGDNDLDIFTAGITIAIDGYPAQFTFPPDIWLNEGLKVVGGSPNTDGIYKFRSPFATITYFLNPNEWYSLCSDPENPVAPNCYVEQKAVFLDWNSDNKKDIVMVDPLFGILFFQNTRSANGHGNVSFTNIGAYSPYTVPIDHIPREVIVGDINKDTKPDLLVFGKLVPFGPVVPVEVLMHNSAFVPPYLEETVQTLPPIQNEANGGVLFDMDNDGDQDLYLYCNGQDRLYENRTP